MRRTGRLLALSLTALAVTVAAYVGFVSAMPRSMGVAASLHGMLRHPKPDEVAVWLLIGIVLLAVATANSRLDGGMTARHLILAAGAAALIGLVGGAVNAAIMEHAFQRLFPQGGASGGWLPGQARAEFMYVNHAAALIGPAFGFMSSSLLLFWALLRSRASRAGP